MEDKKNIQETLFNAITDRPIQVDIDGTPYAVSPPSIGTIIEVSALISSFSNEEPLKDELVVNYVLRTARNCRLIPSVIALLILGCKKYNSNEKTIVKATKRGFFSKLFRLNKTVAISARDLLEEKILLMSPVEIHSLLSKLLSSLQLDFFFYITTSLKEINTTKPTKETSPIVSTPSSGDLSNSTV